MGLSLNPSKCKVISHPDANIVDQTVSLFTFMSVADATLLGAPLFPGKVLDDTWLARCEDLKRAVDRLSLLSAQDALLLLQVSFSAPRVQQLLRCVPSVDNPDVDLFDRHLWSVLRGITNTSFSDTHWLQATLPIKHGGLGICQVRSLALPAFLASRALRISSRRFCWHRPALLTPTLIRTSQTGRGTCSPVSFRPFAGQAVSLGQTKYLSSRTTVESAISDSCQKARFLAAAAPHSGDWLLALPVTSCLLQLTDEAVRVAVSLCLGCSVCVAHTCRCGALVDAQGIHGSVCKQAPSKIARHQAINDVIACTITAAGVPITKEPVGLTRLDIKQHDGLTFIPWQGGKPLTWNVTIVSTLADSYLHSTSHSAGSAAETASVRKESKYSSLPYYYTLCPKKVTPLNILQQPPQTCTDLNEILHTQDDIYFCHRRQIS